MIQLKINNLAVSVSEGSTVLDAAKKLNIDIPTLCYLDGCDIFTSCMVCVVLDTKRDQLIPACSALAAEGMEISTENDRVKSAQQETINMLLSEHVGDCEAPCTRTCPANMNIPLMIRQIQKGQLSEAIQTVKHDIALPAVLGRICPAPCEAGCNRKKHDGAVSICLLKRYVADVDLAQDQSYTPEVQPDSGKTIAVVGGGPTGLAAAYYLAQKGHIVKLYDQSNNLGGQLRTDIPDDQLHKSVLDAEINQILKLDVTFVPNHTLGKEFTLDDLQRKHDAVVLAIGTIDPSVFDKSNLDLTPKGIAINRQTYETSLPGVFAGGNAITQSNRAIRAVAHGKEIAWSVDQFVRGEAVVGEPKRFDSRIGKLQEGEILEYLKESVEADRIAPPQDKSAGYSKAEATQEALRCFHCDCRKPDSCKLRSYGEAFQADQNKYKIGKRPHMKKIIQPGHVIYEPGKCIKCGLCVQITKKQGEALGLSFVGRGFEVRVEVPFNESLEAGLVKAGEKCIEACPTAALSKHE